MKNTLIICILLAMQLFLQSCADKEIELKQVWEVEDAFLSPESVVYDARRDLLYVSNVNLSEDANGKDSIFAEFISRIDLQRPLIASFRG